VKEENIWVLTQHLYYFGLIPKTFGTIVFSNSNHRAKATVQLKKTN